MMTITYIAAGIVLLGLCIFIHELGHLLGGRMVGIKAKVFSLGYGKGFIKKQWGDTTYQITLIPLGGYCQFYGEDPSEERGSKEYEFLSAHPMKRIVAVVMGPIFNLIFGILIFFALNMAGYNVKTNKILISEQLSGGKILSPAAEAGLTDGDEIVSINGAKIYGFTDIQTAVVFSEGKELKIQYKRGSEQKDTVISPLKSDDSGRFAVSITPYGERVLVAGVVENSPADKAGVMEMDEIAFVDGIPVKKPSEFIASIKDKAEKKIVLSIIRRGSDKQIEIVPVMKEFITITDVEAKGKKNVSAEIDTASLKKIMAKKPVTVDGNRLTDADELLVTAKKSVDRTVKIKIGDEEFTGLLSVGKRPVIGFHPAVAPQEKRLEFSFAEGLAHAFVEPYKFIVYNLKGMGMLFSGEMKVRENLSGPIRIVKIAGDIAYYEGFTSFMLMMAKISIILMVMNLLPIPMVDGSHIIFFLIEFLRGKPLNDKLMERIQTVGLVLLISLGAFVIINDISMLPIVQKFFN